MESSVKDRIRVYLRHKNIKGVEFCKTIGVSSGFISGIRKSIQPDKIKSIAINYPDINTEWLLTGKGNMLKDESPAFANESEFISYLKSQIDELKQDNEDLKLRNERLAEQNGYYKGLLDNNGISYKQTAS